MSSKDDESAPLGDDVESITDEIFGNEVTRLAGKADGVTSPASENPYAVEGEVGCGDTVDCYELIEILGQGGFGTVFRAHQTSPVRRDVALKVIKSGMNSAEVVGRFDAERQALAVMDHPGIAKVLDAGTTQTGQPYFVMELVKGEPITRYCKVHRLTISDRLKLFIDVCRAIQHAHSKGIIHRDIKPSNILVSTGDGDLWRP